MPPHCLPGNGMVGLIKPGGISAFPLSSAPYPQCQMSSQFVLWLPIFIFEECPVASSSGQINFMIMSVGCGDKLLADCPAQCLGVVNGS